MRFERKNLARVHGKFVGSFEKRNLKFRRKIMGGFFTFSVLTISWNVFYIGDTIQLRHENPYVSQNPLSREDISLFF